MFADHVRSSAPPPTLADLPTPLVQVSLLQSFDVLTGSSTPDDDFKAHIESIPDGTIVLVGVWDDAYPCNSNCEAAFAMIGAFGAQNDRGIILFNFVKQLFPHFKLVSKRQWSLKDT